MTNDTQTVQLTDAAVAQLKALLEQTGEDDLALRISVKAGGCAGFQYDMAFDNTAMDGDVRTSVDGVTVVVDRMSIGHLVGEQGAATIDWVSTLQKQSFTIDNPNSTGGCGCGNSFC
jgi:iron-sulfur cluster assembly accessory protein